jgi:RND superfamily putative drug exporter
MPIMTALLAIVAGTNLNALISHELDLSSATEAVALMIALGVGVDYSLFIVARFRTLLAAGENPKAAAAGAVNTSGRAVVFAGCLVILALLGMLLLRVTITDGIAVTAAVEVAFTMGAAITLLPAVLSLLGHRVNALPVPGRHPGTDATASPRLAAWTGLVWRRRWLFAGAVTGLLLVLAAPVITMRLGSSAIIMVAVFASFILGGQRLLAEIGVGLAVAVALDAFLIRFVLVPAVMYILGPLNWRLPGWLRWLPTVHAEPDAPVEPPSLRH